jgi:membrane protein
MFIVTSCRILFRAGRMWSTNQDARAGAALAYYTLFSIAPLLVLAIHIAGIFYGDDAAKGKVAEHLHSVVGPDSAKMIQSLIENTDKTRDTSFWTSRFSLVMLVVASLSLFLNLRSSLCKIWKLEPPRGSTVLGVLLDYFLALVMVFVSGVLLLTSLAASFIVPILHGVIQDNVPFDLALAQYVELASSFVFLTILFASTFRILSGSRIPWGYVWYGSVISAILFTLGKTLLGYYFVYTRAASTYGAAGSLVVFLMWVYYSAQILFFGAELIQARRTRRDWLNGKTPDPIPVD